MYTRIFFILLLGVQIQSLQFSPALAEDSSSQLSDKEKERIKAQAQALKKSKLSESESFKKNIKQDALRQAEAIDQKVNQQSKFVDKAVENFSPRLGPEYANTLGTAKKQQLLDKANIEKEKIATEARKKAATKASIAKKNADNIDKSVEGLKSQVNKSGKFGLKPKGSSLYVRNYSGK